MPELPEVEILCRNLRRWLKGREVRLEDLDFGCGDRRMVVTEVRRRAKVALIQGNETWVVHLRMTGKVVPSRPEGRTRARFHAGADSYDFEDTRRLGTLTVVDRFDDTRLGPEPWPTRRDGSWWEQQLARGGRGAIKPTLMRQELVAGLGNIAANEILFRAGIRPDRPTRAVTRWQGLAEAAYDYLTETIRDEEGDEILYINQGGPNPFRVYQRTRCTACAGPVARSVQHGRATFSCGGCQV